MVDSIGQPVRSTLDSRHRRNDAAWEPSGLSTIAIIAGRKCPTFTMICAYIRPHLLGRATPMTAQFHEITDAEFEVQVRNLVRIVSACTLGLWSFSAGLLIGGFFLF